MPNQRPRTHRLQALLLTALIALIAGLPLTNTQAAKTGDSFGDWSVLCQALNDDGSAQACHIFQAISDRDSKQMLVNAEVGYLPENPDLLISLTVPLGIAIPPGIRVEIDGKAAFTVPLAVCLKQGCRSANLFLDKKAEKRLRRGNKAEIVIKNLQGRDIAIPLSLQGISKALDSLKSPATKAPQTTKPNKP